MTITRFMIVLYAVLAVGVWPGAATPPHFEILIENGAPYFFPAVATVPAGTPIRWDNPTATEHTITHDGCLTEGPCAFDSHAMPPNGHYILPGLPPGTYPYHCRIHPIMRGTLTVTDSSSSPRV